jgi:predicted ATP-binding protein involved in virulence
VILKNLSLTNYRGFEQLEIDFHEKVNVIAGINGVGKSSVLHALRVLFSRVLNDVVFDRMTKASFSEDDVQSEESSLNVGCEFEIDDAKYWAVINRISSSPKWTVIWARGLYKADQEALIAKQDKDKTALSNANDKIRTYKSFLNSRADQYALRLEALNFMYGQIQNVEPLENLVKISLSNLRSKIDLPLVVYYSPLRHVFKKVTKLPETTPFSTDKAFENALQETEIDLRHFMHWFKFLEQSDNPDSKQKREFILAALRQSVTAFIPEFSNLRLEETPKPRLIVDKNGVALELGQLSDGERGLLVLVFDLTRRLALANPSSSNPISDGKAIVLIDELELHLHPSWQRHVLKRLTNTFQNCQFMITTHSPQIIGQVKPESLILLTREPETEKIIVKRVGQSFAMDSNWVLQEIMGTTARDYETEQKISAIYELLDSNLTEARAIADGLEQEIGEFPELRTIKGMLDRLELLAGDE